ncbi:hypothetical protein BD289DRAFT_442901 [Coniella lustricola]|uniref:Glycosyl transferase CAP10 domain-containing protein n=1 Tax=Coniella lustricola TaxID=2025994 RepID=A0A2T2ZXT0_9PEZI|nr:hypothetical protein BD289DRAFT_442901 [Coniella lustricola]
MDHHATTPCFRPLEAPRLHGFLSSPGAFAVTNPAMVETATTTTHGQDQQQNPADAINSDVDITSSLMPIFSQARPAGFRDILVPSPWNFVGKVDLDPAHDKAWADKDETVFWRGGLTDGFSRDQRAWTGFLRARFVNLAKRHAGWNIGEKEEVAEAAAEEEEQQGVGGGEKAGMGQLQLEMKTKTKTPKTPQHRYSKDEDDDDNDKIDTHLPLSLPPPLTVNVSFVGPFTRCHEQDCRAATDTFYSGPLSSSSSSHLATTNPHRLHQPPTMPPTGPASIDFQAHWSYRHLIDLDGAGFSGRFIPFVRSNSAVYRATIFRTWYDERVFPWTHYVPLDVSLRGVWGVLDFVRGWAVGPASDASDASEASEAREELKPFTSGPHNHHHHHQHHLTRLDESIAHQGSDWARRALRREDMQVYMFRLLLEWGRLVNDHRDEIGYTG